MSTTSITAKRPRLAAQIEREEFALCVRHKPVVSIERDATYPNMWRIKTPTGSLSDMLNVTRAKDMALDMAEAIEARKTPHKSPLKSLDNFSWLRSPAARDGKSDQTVIAGPETAAVARAAS